MPFFITIHTILSLTIWAFKKARFTIKNILSIILTIWSLTPKTNNKINFTRDENFVIFCTFRVYFCIFNN